MANTTGIPVRLISYGDSGVNRVGLNPVSGRVEDPGPRCRERWAMWSRTPNEHGATYGETVIEYDIAVGKHSVFGALGLLTDDIETPKLTELPAHEDIFATDVFAAIVDDDDIMIDVDPIFVGVSHPNLIR